MRICKLIPLSSPWSIYTTLIYLQLLFSMIIVIENSPLVPILTAIATSAAGLFQIQVDTLHIAKYLKDASHHKRNRAAFVRDLLYTAFYRSGQVYNVMVFNLAEEHRQRLYGVNFYGSVAFTDHTRFGIWVFEYGMFQNLGARGWHNWGMIGTFKKSQDGATIFFHRRHRPKPDDIFIDIHEPSYNSSTTTSTTTIPSNILNNTIITATEEPSPLKAKDLQSLLGLDNDPLFKLDQVEIKNEHQQQEEEKSRKHKIKITIEDKRTKNNNSKKKFLPKLGKSND